MKKIAVIDPFVVTPSLSSFNHLVRALAAKLTYHHPQQGLEELMAAAADGFILLGSAAFVHERLSWHRKLADYLLIHLQEQRPVLGLCFGHQLLCDRFGSHINYHTSTQSPELGYRDIQLSHSIYGLEAGSKLRLAVKHQQVVKTLAEDLEEVGVGLPFDIVRHKSLPFLGVQAHPEGDLSFCGQEAMVASDQIPTVQADGLKLIKSFFHHYQILANID